MDSKIAVNIAMVFGAFVFGGVFFTVVKEDGFLMGVFSGALFGVVAGLGGLGLLSSFINKDEGVNELRKKLGYDQEVDNVEGQNGHTISDVDIYQSASGWSDEKLVHMREKLRKKARAHFDRGNFDDYKSYADKKDQLDSIILKREQAHQAEQGNLFKQDTLFEEDSVSVITDKALLAADEGDVKAQALVGTAYLAGSNGLPQDLYKASKYLLKAAEQDHAHASFVVAGLYIEGIGLPYNSDMARLWAVKAKSLGYPEADQMLLAIDAAKSK